MAKITEIRVAYGKTVNTGNYNSFRYDVEFKAILNENENPDEIVDQLRSHAKLKVAQAINYERKGEPQKLKEPWEEVY